jgi:hypothetical protein
MILILITVLSAGCLEKNKNTVPEKLPDQAKKNIEKLLH